MSEYTMEGFLLFFIIIYGIQKKNNETQTSLTFVPAIGHNIRYSVFFFYCRRWHMPYIVHIGFLEYIEYNNIIFVSALCLRQ